MNYDIVIQNGTFITMNSDLDIINNGVLCIKNDKLDKIEPLENNASLPIGETIIDAHGGIIMPGLVNTHTHLPMALFRGLADDLPLSKWLNEYIFPAEANHIHSESVRIGALLSCAEMLLSGTTTCCDGYFHEDSVASAANEIGIRAILGQGVIDFPAPGVPKPENNVNNAITFIQKWKNISPLIIPSIFCHSPYTCSGATLKKAKDAAETEGVLFQIHVGETKDECLQIQTKHHTTPIKYLDKMGIIDKNTLLIHAVWMDDDDIEIIAKRRGSVSHNPESNMKLASGIAPVPALLKAGVTVGLGTDGCASNNNLDLFSEMDTAAKLHKVSAMDPMLMDAVTVLKMATIEGARSLGLHDITGSLEVGKQADVIILDTHKPHLVPVYNPVSHIVYAAQGSDVQDVIVNGRILVKDRKLLSVDLGHILEKVINFSKNISPNLA
ncbi:MAG: amidohydrolase [Deltaproteobacteria bacterium]|jgi:5-methylthioadenosine/S-adenosylhomocysteine deaminase|nr:amidohydrolase [Deltaproteobacteria bacterium]